MMRATGSEAWGSPVTRVRFGAIKWSENNGEVLFLLTHLGLGQHSVRSPFSFCNTPWSCDHATEVSDRVALASDALRAPLIDRTHRMVHTVANGSPVRAW